VEEKIEVGLKANRQETPAGIVEVKAPEFTSGERDEKETNISSSVLD
jgi:hypothetical protein